MRIPDRHDGTGSRTSGTRCRARCFRPAGVDLAGKLHALDGRVLFSAHAAACKGQRSHAAPICWAFFVTFCWTPIAHPYIEARFFGCAAYTPAEIQMDLDDDRPDPSFRGSRVRRSASFTRTKPPARAGRAAHRELSKSLFPAGEKRAHLPAVFTSGSLVNSISYDPQKRKLRFFGAS